MTDLLITETTIVGVIEDSATATTVVVTGENSAVVTTAKTELLIDTSEMVPTLVSEGVQGPAGARGDTGEAGPAGTSGDASYTFVQAAPLSIWTITHQLGKFPSATVVDSAGNEVEGLVQHTGSTQLTISFSSPFGGAAYLN